MSSSLFALCSLFVLDLNVSIIRVFKRPENPDIKAHSSLSDSISPFHCFLPDGGKEVYLIQGMVMDNRRSWWYDAESPKGFIIWQRLLLVLSPPIS
jgi:hypothetical protein